MKYYRRYIGDYHRDTMSLSLIEHAYTVLLDAYYASDGHIPNDIEDLYRLCRATTNQEKKAVFGMSNAYFKINGSGTRHNARADKELEIAIPAIEKMRFAGLKGSKKRWGGS